MFDTIWATLMSLFKRSVNPSHYQIICAEQYVLSRRYICSTKECNILIAHKQSYLCRLSLKAHRWWNRGDQCSSPLRMQMKECERWWNNVRRTETGHNCPISDCTVLLSDSSKVQLRDQTLSLSLWKRGRPITRHHSSCWLLLFMSTTSTSSV